MLPAAVRRCVQIYLKHLSRGKDFFAEREALIQTAAYRMAKLSLLQSF